MVRKSLRVFSLIAAAIVAAAAELVPLTPAEATPINYTLSGASANFNNVPPLIPITGSFTFDTATDTESNVSISAGGDTFTQTAAHVVGAANEIVAADQFAIEIFIDFKNPLNVANDPITSALDQGLNALSITDVTGSAVSAASTIPEPGTLNLLVGALGALFLSRWVVCRKGRHPNLVVKQPA